MRANHTNRMKRLLYLLMLLPLTDARGQAEFLGVVNPATGTYARIKGIPDVHWVRTQPDFITYDKQNHHYIFLGGDAEHNYYLYSVDALTGNVVSRPPFPVLTDEHDNIMELQYDNVSKKLYGLHWDQTEEKQFLVSIDPVTGDFQKISDLPNVRKVTTAVHYSALCEIEKRYVFRGGDGMGNWYLYSVDISSGDIIYSPPFPVLDDPDDHLMELQYDNSGNILYGLFWDNSESAEYLVSVNPATGNFSRICRLQGVRLINTLHHYTTFDEARQKYVFGGCDEEGIWRLYSVDITNQTVSSNPVFPNLANGNDHLIGLQVDNLTGVYYSLYWSWDAPPVSVKNKTFAKADIDLFPNPFSSTATVSLNRTYRKLEYFVYDVTGKVVAKGQNSDVATIIIPRGNLQAGSYFLSLYGDHTQIGFEKFLIQ
jgi:hypothetical protein